MSDIRRHLPAIIGCIREHVTPAADHTMTVSIQSCCKAITALLPATYNAVPFAHLIDDNGTLTPPVDILILNQAIPAKTPRLPANTWPFRRAFAAIMVGRGWNYTDLSHATQVIGQVKALQAPPVRLPRQAASVRHAVPHENIPLGILCMQRYVEQQAEVSATRCQAIAAVLHQQPEEWRADFVYVFADAVRYQHPAIDGQRFSATTINFGRECEATKTRTCYICKTKFTRLHPFYELLCVACGDGNYQKRQAAAAAPGRIALVTGGRVGIGYQVVLRLLRAGALVIATTRFPCAAARQFAAEPDCVTWQDRLHLYALDLRYIPLLEQFIQHIGATYSHLDILVNNAAQTVRQPPAYHDALLAQEQKLLAELPVIARQMLQPTQRTACLPALSPLLQGKQSAVLTRRPADDAGHSWHLRIGDVMDVTELLETQVINVTAPYLLINRLLTLLQHSPQRHRFIVNVTSAEGQFAPNKHGSHPHTNMAKAALNMLTYTVATDLAANGIYLNSVDPGWIAHQGATTVPSPATDKAGLLPLDAIDGAARVCDPIFVGMTASAPVFGKLLKDYQAIAW